MSRHIDPKDVPEGMAVGYIIWHNRGGVAGHNYPSYPVMEWTTEWWSKWQAALMTDHPQGKVLETLGGFAGYDEDQDDPTEFSLEFTFPSEWMEGVEDVNPYRRNQG